MTANVEQIVADALIAGAHPDAIRAAIEKASNILVDVEREHQAMLAAEAAADVERQAAYDRAVVNRDAAAKLIRDRYADLADELAALLEVVAASDAELEKVNADRPRGAPPLAGADWTARELTDHNAHFLTRRVELPGLREQDEPFWGMSRFGASYGGKSRLLRLPEGATNGVGAGEVGGARPGAGQKAA